jgi:Flp pilus assembly CpaF family ATPase
MAERVLANLLAPLAALMSDAAVSEILVNAPTAVWIERKGCLEAAPGGVPFNQLRAIARVLATLSGADSLDRDGALEGAWQDWRITVVLPPVAREHGCLAMRRHRHMALPLALWTSTTRHSAMAEDAAAPDPEVPSSWVEGAPVYAPADALQLQLHRALATRANLLIAGGTGTGKTTLLAGLLAAIPASERIVCLEDSPELPCAGGHQVRLLASSGHTLRSLLRLALRLRPDRIVIGEVRGTEAFDLLQAMATGHSGCVGTIHAADPLGALLRLEQLILSSGLAWPLAAIRAQIALCIGLVIQLSRTPEGRAVQAIHCMRGLAGGEYWLEPLLPEEYAGST